MGDKRAPKGGGDVAALGRDYLDWMKARSQVTDNWATEDRATYTSAYRPREFQFIDEAIKGMNPQTWEDEAAKAKALSMRSAGEADQQRKRSMAAMGIDPTSGTYQGIERSKDLGDALNSVTAQNQARDAARTRGIGLLGDVVNMGHGLPAQTAGTYQGATSGVAAGYGGAMQGTQDAYQNKLTAYGIKQQGVSDLMSGLGSVAGLAYASSKEKKVRHGKARGILKSLKKVPVEEWTYKDGEGDGGSHVGPMAEDFAKATGKGDGKSIGVIDSIGTALGAVKELDAKVDKLADQIAKVIPMRPRGIKIERRAA